MDEVEAGEAAQHEVHHDPGVRQVQDPEDRPAAGGERRPEREPRRVDRRRGQRERPDREHEQVENQDQEHGAERAVLDPPVAARRRR